MHVTPKFFASCGAGRSGLSKVMPRDTFRLINVHCRRADFYHTLYSTNSVVSGLEDQAAQGFYIWDILMIDSCSNQNVDQFLDS